METKIKVHNDITYTYCACEKSEQFICERCMKSKVSKKWGV